MNLNFAKMPAFTFLPDAPSQGSTRQDAVRQGSTIGSRLAAVVAYVASLPRRRRQLAELSSFSDRELADIGLNRGDIPRVNDPKFAADYAERRRSAIFFLKA